MATQTAAPPPIAPKTASAPAWPFLLYALTGFTGVLAEQGFEKSLSLLVGATAAASAVVIFAYFLGFAAGSWAIGALARRRRIANPLRAYGAFEFLAGASCVAFSYLFHPIVQVLAPWQSLYSNPLLKFAVRFAFGGILILPTAALMGASFPLIAQAVDRHNLSAGRSWLRAYASNLAGALFAAVAGAYALLPLIGIRGALWLCFAICTVVFLVCLIAGRSQPDAAFAQSDSSPSQPAAEAAQPDRDAPTAWPLLLGAFASGFAFFALEVIWTHLISTAIGNSVYAFSAMLATVLAGLLIAAFRIERSSTKDSAISYSRIFQLTALFLLIQLRFWDWIQAAYLVPLPSFLRNFYGVEGYKLLLAALLIVPSATLLGSIFPSLLRSPILERPGRSYLVGYLNTANSLGCILGAIAGIFLLIPALGAEWSLKLIILIALAMGMLFAFREGQSRRKLLRTAEGIFLVALCAIVCRWDHRLIAAGLNVYFGQTQPTESGSAAPSSSPDPSSSGAKLVFFDESVQGGMTSVLELTNARGAKEHVMLTNGKFEGTDDLMQQGYAQIGVAAVPSLYNSNFGPSLLIGLGTGHSALALARLGYSDVDIAEFAPGVVRASRAQFSRLTENVLDFPNVSLKLEDGRNILAANPNRKYDLVTVEITSVWFAGATNVYSKEFYELVKQRLRPGGVLQQWLQLHHISPREVESAVATVRSVFPYVSFWYTGGQGMIVATSQPQTSTPEREALLADRMRALIPGDPSMQAGVADRTFHSRVISPAGVDRMLASVPAVINTDHNRWLEYATPRFNWSETDWIPVNLNFLRSFESGN